MDDEYPEDALGPGEEPADVTKWAWWKANRVIDELRAERDNLRGMFESITDELWLDLKDIDWCDWQEEAKRRGLIVVVTTTDPDFIGEWDSDQMLVYAWSDAAREGESDGKNDR